MRKYKLTVMALAALAAITFSACASDTDVAIASDSTPENLVNTSPTIVFKLSVPSNSSLHYNNTRAVGDALDDSDIDEEATIKSLYMYEFDAATDQLVNKVDITSIILLKPAGTTGGITSGTAALTAKDYVYEYKPGVKLTYNDARQFLFVANYPSLAADVVTVADNPADPTTITTLTAVKSMVTDALTGTIDQKSVWTTISSTDVPPVSTDVLPMTAFAMFNNSDVIPVAELNAAGDNVVTTTVDLTRIVARIDVVNNTPELVVDEIQLIKANDRSYLLAETETTDRTASPLPTANTKVIMAFDKTKVIGTAKIASASESKPYWDQAVADKTAANAYLTTFAIPEANISATADANGSVVTNPVKLEQAFYIYEDIERDQVNTGEVDGESNPIYKVADDVLRIQVRGTLKGIPVSYNIPFSKDLIEGAATSAPKTGFAIKRNYLYTVMLGDGKPAPIQTGVKVKIKVLDWNQQEVTDYFDASIFKIYKEDVTNTQLANNNTTPVTVGDTEAGMIISTKTINVVQGTAGTPIEFIIGSPYTEVNSVVATLQSVDGDANLHAWVTIEPLDGTGTPTAVNKGYKVTIQPNTGSTPKIRNASIKVEYMVNSTQQTNITYTIVQANS